MGCCALSETPAAISSSRFCGLVCCDTFFAAVILLSIVDSMCLIADVF